MFISVATIIVYTTSYYDSLSNYYNENMSNPDETYKYLTGINTIMDLDYFVNIPLYSYSVTQGDQQFTLRVYAMGYTLNKKLYDGIMIFVNQVKIVEEDELVLNPKIKIEVTLSDKTYQINTGEGKVLTDKPYSVFDPDKTYPYSYIPVLFLSYSENYLLKEDDTFATVDSIKISYSNGETGVNGFMYNNKALFYTSTNHNLVDQVLNDQEAFFVDYNYEFDHDNYQLTKSFNLGPNKTHPDLDDIRAFQLVTESGDLRPYNIVIWRNMTIYVLVVLGLTYVLFFHKKVKEKYFNKKYGQNKKDLKALEEKSLFKDEVVIKKDGK